MNSMPEKPQEQGFGFSLAEAKKRREEMDARKKWERDVERLAAELLSQHTAEELAVIAAQHVIYREAIEALNVELKEVNTALQAESAMKFSPAEHAELSTKIAIAVRNGYRSYRASIVGKRGHEKRPQTAAKAEVHKYWKVWQQRPEIYKSDAEFARDMLEKFDALTSPDVIARWCRKWRKSEPC